MDTKDLNITILGCGSLGESLLKGLLAAGHARERVIVSARRPERLSQLKASYGIMATADNHAAIATADVVLLAVKPQMVAGLVQPLATELDDRLVVSACAGVSLQRLAGWLPGSRLIRVMPNTPTRVRAGMTVVSPGPGATDGDVTNAQAIFDAVGRSLVLEEKHLDAVTGLSGSGPAFAFVILEALADGGVMMGLPRGAALELASQTMLGAAKLLLEEGRHPAALKDDVTTPAGCTIAGLLVLEDGGIRSTLARAIQEATRVAKGLGD